MTNANSSSHYMLMTVGVIITLIGVFLRFMTSVDFIDIVSNIVFIIGVIICFKSVFSILKG